MHPVLFQFGAIAIPSYGVLAAIGVLAALGLSHRTARVSALDPRHLWNILVLGVFAALVISRLTLIVINLSNLRAHPRWLLALALVHHPLLAAIGMGGAALAVAIYLAWAQLPMLAVADALAAPLAVGIVFEQVGALLAGSGYGIDASIPWAVTYSSTYAARWSGTPLGVALHPAQAYAALGSLLIAGVALLCPRLLSRRRPGDIAGLALIGAGIVVFLTENFRDWEGRGVVFHGRADAPQVGAVLLVLLGGILLADLKLPQGDNPPNAPSGASHG